jgi:adenylate cyclase
MVLEEFFNKNKVLDLSFFNFENAITAAYFADSDFNISRVNANFQQFFPMIKNLQGSSFPEVLTALGVDTKTLENFLKTLEKDGKVLIPRLEISNKGVAKVYSLLTTRTNSANFSFLRGYQGQFIDRTQEDVLRREKERLLIVEVANQRLLEEKTSRLEKISKRLASYLAPQVYESIFNDREDKPATYSRKNLTIFFSDIVSFTELSDRLEPEVLAKIINNYLSEMSTIAMSCGGTIDKFIGDAIMVFFGDPISQGEKEDALAAVEMAIKMQVRIGELQGHWADLGIPAPLRVRMGVSTGFCTVGDFGSKLRLDYTAFGSPVNLAARLQSAAPPDNIVISEQTHKLIDGEIKCADFETMTPKGFPRPISTYLVDQEQNMEELSSVFKIRGDRVSIDIFDSSDVSAAIEELKKLEGQIHEIIAKQKK